MRALTSFLRSSAFPFRHSSRRNFFPLHPIRPIYFFYLTLFLLSAPISSLCAATNKIDLIYDGNLIQKAEVSHFNKVPYLSLKAGASLFKGKTQWFPIAGRVVFHLNNQKVTFTIDNRMAVINEKKMSMDGAAKLVKGVVYVPVSLFVTPAFQEISGCKVEWDATGRVLSVEPIATLFSPRIYGKENITRIVFESAEEVTCDVKAKGKIITLEIPKVKIAAEEEVKIKDNIVQSLKVSRNHKGAVIKISLSEKTTHYHFTQEDNPPRLILEFMNPHRLTPEAYQPPAEQVAAKTPSETGAPAPSEPAEKSPEANPAVTENSESPKKMKLSVSPKIRKIVVDAGHGGKDAGAIGRSGTKEKDINLLIALELARILKIEGGYEVYLTRSDDTFISLHERTELANEKQADLFVSIHCNASIRRKQGGFEIYFLSDNASDPHAEAAAEMENSVVEMEDQHSKEQKVQELLFEMAKNEFINESSLLCNSIGKAVKSRCPIENRGTKQANFHVLHGAAMPAVLVETAFITKPDEEQKLKQRKFRSAIVDAILTGIENYQKKLEVLEGVK